MMEVVGQGGPRQFTALTLKLGVDQCINKSLETVAFDPAGGVNMQGPYKIILVTTVVAFVLFGFNVYQVFCSLRHGRA